VIALKRLRSGAADFEPQLDALLAFESAQDPAVEAAVAAILEDVKKRGDIAVLDYARRFDRVQASSVAELELSRGEMERALAALAPAQRGALEQAAARVRSYHEKQLAQSWHYIDEDGTQLGQQVTALDRVGVYVPGGKAAYPSTVLMNALPAKIAGVHEIVMAVPMPGGDKSPLVLAAAALAGVDRAFTIGGAHAIGALAYGTQTVPRVDKIVGPGNAYVAAAKRRVYGAVGIDMVAGPSEILVVCDGVAPVPDFADWIAMDLFSQAEHDELAQAILVSPDAEFIDQVAASIERQLMGMPRRDIIKTALETRGALIEVRDLDEACDLVNRIAPEHLELAVTDPHSLLKKIRHAGAIFLGNYTSEALGDYCAGPNHVLPTSRTARFSSPLGVYDFQKRSSIISVSKEGARRLGAIAAELARGEGLPAHAKSAEYRMRSEKS
jgi:histidinol dehydrogenase